MEKHGTGHYRRRHQATNDMEPASGNPEVRFCRFRADPEKYGQQEHYGGQQLKRTDNICAVIGKQIARSGTGKPSNPLSDGAEYVLRIRMIGEFVGQGTEKDVAHPGHNDP